MKLGFCGLGTMGLPMVRHLIDAGHEVTAWSHHGEKAEQLAQEFTSVTAAATPRKVAAASEVTFVIVGDTAMSDAVVLGDSGLLSGAAPGSVIVDASTVSPEYSRRAAELCSARGVDFIDAPCTGSKPGAEAATLTFMIGGPTPVVERVRPLIEPMAGAIHHCGGIGLGMAAKLSQNLILANLSEAFSEAMVLATKAGVDPAQMLDILETSAARSGYAAFKAPYIFDRNFESNFSLRWMTKDVALMLEEAASLDVVLPLTERTHELLTEAISAGFGDDDFCGVIRQREAQAGVTVEPTDAVPERS